MGTFSCPVDVRFADGSRWVAVDGIGEAHVRVEDIEVATISPFSPAKARQRCRAHIRWRARCWPLPGCYRAAVRQPQLWVGFQFRQGVAQ